MQKSGLGYQTLPTNAEFLAVNTNKWYEVEALAQDEVFVEDPSMPSDEVGTKVGKYLEVNQRFTTQYTPEGYFFLTFGGGNQTSQDLLDDFAKKGVKLNMSQYMNNIALGNMVQGNSTLFIQYRIGGGKVSNLGAGAITNVGKVNFVVAGPNGQINQSVVDSLAVTNVTSAIGGADPMSVEEIRNYISYNFAAQNRAVTINDYVSKLRMMPSTFGAPAKVGVTEIENKVMLNILSYTPDGKLTSEVTSTLKSNIATYLSNYRMMNDYIVVGPAKVIDISFLIDLIIEDSFNSGAIVGNVVEQVTNYFNINKIEMGQDLSMGELRSQIMNQPGVLNIVNLRIYNKVGGQYSQSITSQPYGDDSTREIALLDDTIYAQPDEILQVRFPEKDIAIRVRKPNKPTFT